MNILRNLFIILLSLFYSHAPILHADLSQQLLQAVQNPMGWPSLHYALYMNQEEAADWLLNKYPELAFESTPPIKLIASTDYMEKRDHEYPYGNEEGLSALELALKQKNTRAALKILEQPVDVNHSRKEGKGNFDNYWMNSSYTIVIEWVKKVNVNFLNMNPSYTYEIFTPLYWAIVLQDIQVIEALIQHEVDLRHVYVSSEQVDWVSGRITRNLNALDAAVLWGNREIVKKLLRYQLQLANKSFDSEAEIDLPESVVDLVYHFSNNQEGNSALFQTLYEDDSESFEILLDYAFNPNELDRARCSLFDIAMEHPNPLFASILASKFPNSLFLMDSVKKGRKDLVQELLKNDLNVKQALLESIRLENDAIALMLLSYCEQDQDDDVLSLIVQKNQLMLFEKVQSVGWTLPETLLSQAIRAHAETIAFHILDNALDDLSVISPEHYFLCISENELGILQKLIQMQGLSSELKEELILAALEQGRDKIFTYLLQI